MTEIETLLRQREELIAICARMLSGCNCEQGWVENENMPDDLNYLIESYLIDQSVLDLEVTP
jgi:hypothetical protein